MFLGENNKMSFIKEKIVFIKSLFESKKISRGVKNASYLTIGHFITMAINFFGFIYIARILQPTDYGIYVSVVSFVGLFDILTFKGFNKVILREGSKDLNQMGYYFEKSIGLKLFFTILSIIVCVFSSIILPYSLQEKIYIVIYSLILIHHSLFGFFSTIFQAAEKMQYISALKILDRTFFIGLSIIFLYFGFGILALIMLSVVIEIFILIINYRLTKKFIKFKFLTKIKIDKRIIKPALVFSILSFTVLVTTKIDLVMLSWLGTSRDVGIYGVAHQILRNGSNIKTLIAISFYPIFIKTFHNRIIKWRIILKYSFLLGFGILILAIIGSIISVPLITFLFGEAYSESGVILSVLIFYLVFSFYSIPFTNILQATHNEIINLSICWITPASNIILNYIFFNIFGVIGIAYSTLVSSSLFVPILVFTCWRFLKKQNRIK